MIRFDAILWDDPSDRAGNVAHIAAHGVTPAEVEEVLRGPNGRDDWSRSSNLPTRSGWTTTGKHLIVVYRVFQTRATVAVRPVTAYEVDPY